MWIAYRKLKKARETEPDPDEREAGPEVTAEGEDAEKALEDGLFGGDDDDDEADAPARADTIEREEINDVSDGARQPAAARSCSCSRRAAARSSPTAPCARWSPRSAAAASPRRPSQRRRERRRSATRLSS